MTNTATITVDCASDRGEYRHFWQSTGFTPAGWMLEPDMRQNLLHIGSIPHGGITYVRIHYLLELVGVEGIEASQPAYDWSKLDAALDLLVDNGLKPFFEIMGIPRGSEDFFKDFSTPEQIFAWKRLVRDLAVRCVERYGAAEVESWYFETWNEPDHDSWWAHGIEPFLAYYDACSEGLKEANPRLRFGGPGTCRGVSELFKALLRHCDSGKNYFSGEDGVRIDFISFHVKGSGAKEGCIEKILSGDKGEIKHIEYIREHHPRLASVPVSNNECDPIVGWSRPGNDWHATPYYASWVCASNDAHLSRLIHGMGVDYLLLSNDNGFLHPWEFRTLMARMATDDQLKQGSFALVKKPVFNVMALLSLLGDRRLGVEVDTSRTIGATATARGAEQVAALVYDHTEGVVESDAKTRVRLSLSNLPFQTGLIAHYRIDRDHANPHKTWLEMGSPETPTSDQLAILRSAAEPGSAFETKEFSSADRIVDLEFEVPVSGVRLVLLTAKPETGPSRVERVRVEEFHGPAGPELMVIWDDVGSRAISTYEVLHSDAAAGPFERVNDDDLICTAWLDPNPRGGYYRVRACDYWGRRGPESEPVAAGGLSAHWAGLRNPVLQYADWSIKDYGVAHKDGVYHLFFSAFYEDNGRVRSHVVQVSTRDFKTYSEPILHFDGQEDGWIGMCSPDCVMIGDTYYLTFNSWGDKEGRPNQLFYMTSKDLVNWSPRRPLAENITRGVRAIDAALNFHDGRFVLFWKEVQTTRCCVADAIDGPFRLLGDGYPKFRGRDGREFEWNENYQLVGIDGKWRLLASTHDPDYSREETDDRGRTRTVKTMMPILYTMETGDGSKDDDWLSWVDGYEPKVELQEFNTDHRANSAVLLDQTEIDGFWYMLYAGRTEGASFLRRGNNKLGISRSKDLANWSPAGR